MVVNGGAVARDDPPQRAPAGGSSSLWSDAALVGRARRGDRRALRTLYRRYSGEIFDFAVRFRPEPAAAAAIVEATFVTAGERLRLGIRPQRVEPWLLGIARSLAVDGAEPATVTVPDPGKSADRRVQLAARWARTLTPRGYVMVDLYVRRGFSTHELGALVGIGEQAVRTRLDGLADDFGMYVAYELVVSRSRCIDLSVLLDRITGAEAADRRRAVRMHARKCSSCQAVAQESSFPLGAFAELPTVPLPEELSSAIWSRVARREPEPHAAEVELAPVPRSAARPARRRRPLWVAAGVAGGCAAAAALAVILTDPFGSDTSREAVPPRIGSSASVFTPPVTAKKPPAAQPPAAQPQTGQPPAGAAAAKQKTGSTTSPTKTAAANPPPAKPPAKPEATTTPATAGKPAVSPPATTEKPGTTPQTGVSSKAASSKPAVAQPNAVRALAWAPVPNAIGYEVVLIRNGRQVFKERTTEARTTIPETWSGGGRTIVLGSGYYRWVVWPIMAGNKKPGKAVVVAAVHLD